MKYAILFGWVIGAVLLTAMVYLLLTVPLVER